MKITTLTLLAQFLFCFFLFAETSVVTSGGTPVEPEPSVDPASCALVSVSDAEWKEKLSPAAYRILREQGTERAFTGKYWNSKAEGVYQCVGCGQALFSSEHKFNSGTGWPSYSQPISEDAVGEKVDRSHGMVRTEVHCAQCKGHLGHIFKDGPKPGGLRYCINSVALTFIPKN